MSLNCTWITILHGWTFIQFVIFICEVWSVCSACYTVCSTECKRLLCSMNKFHALEDPRSVWILVAFSGKLLSLWFCMSAFCSFCMSVSFFPRSWYQSSWILVCLQDLFSVFQVTSWCLLLRQIQKLSLWLVYACWLEPHDTVLCISIHFCSCFMLYCTWTSFLFLEFCFWGTVIFVRMVYTFFL
jgi:hypothetical protein